MRKIAVLRANALGDLIVALPAIAAVKDTYPDARLVLLGSAWHADFLRGRPGPVDEVVAMPPITGLTTRPEARPAPEELMGRLRERRFDLAVQIHGGGRHSNPFVRRLGARVTAGFRTPDAEPLDLWLPYVYYQHETLRYLEAAALVGARAREVEPRVAVTAADRAELRDVLGEPPPGLVALHPGATDPRRRWPARRFAAVADRLGRPVVVTGTPEEAGLVAEVVAAMRRPATPLVGALSIGGLAALYQRCALVLANDTGPRHLAAAVGAATIGLYWCGNLVNAGPLTRARHRPLVSWTTACPCCGATGVDLRAGRCAHDDSWIAAITVDEVIEQAELLLGRS
ncbi:glycosyltransferase family 9 protein [Actinomadura sp. ATCC 31491]|uniref:Glycosyltransferase family 9 protein n=1 Tax=Actinomadura luzonensis TaxID=2805427 RepID=A0ABT0FWM3_9ACTN|nr:glycosyltransferase family 9 protein [Actinomadura luzonensis]MCK2216283.1 glycosyltransferase family 9 protein [Actinomadura luzonensis]